MKLILGSSSKFRADVLRSAGFAFETMRPEIDEKAIRDADPERLVLLIANAKADALLPRITEPAILITTDQIVLCNGNIREKPRDRAEARGFLEDYAVHPAVCVNGIVVTNTATAKRAQAIDRTSVYYRPSVLDIVDDMLAEEDTMQTAGGFLGEDPRMIAHMQRLDGSFESMKGMPVDTVRKLIQDVVQP